MDLNIKSDGSSRFLKQFVFVGLQFRQCRADGIELRTRHFVDVVLVVKDVLNFEFESLKVLAQLCACRLFIIFSLMLQHEELFLLPIQVFAELHQATLNDTAFLQLLFIQCNHCR